MQQDNLSVLWNLTLTSCLWADVSCIKSQPVRTMNDVKITVYLKAFDKDFYYFKIVYSQSKVEAKR